MNENALLIGISGASGSGKTLVARTLLKDLDLNRVVFIQEDAYYRDLSHLDFKKRTKINFDHPDAFDHDLMLSQLELLKKGKAIHHPVYDFKTHTRKPETKTIESRDIVIVEGILILAVPEIRNLFDIKIYVDAPLDICFIRRLLRDMQERGRSVFSVINQYEETVRPMYFEFIEKSKGFADIIIPQGGKNLAAIDIIRSRLEVHLASIRHEK